MEHVIEILVYTAKAFVTSVLVVASLNALQRSQHPKPPPFSRN
jgi:hypothetical protein